MGGMLSKILNDVILNQNVEDQENDSIFQLR